LPHGGGVCAIQFSADGALILTACLDGTARLWETRTHQPVEFNPVLKHRAKLVDASFSADGRSILTAGSDGTLTLWDFNSVPLEPQSLGKAASVASPGRLTSPDGRWQVRTNGSTLIFRLRRTRTRIALNLTNTPALMGFDDQSRRFFAVDGSYVRLLDLYQSVSHVLKHPRAVTHARFSSDGLKLVCASADKSLDEMSAQIWATATGLPVGRPLEHGDGVRYACFSPDNQLVVTASEDFSAVLWDASSGVALTPKMVHREKVYHAAFARTQPWAATASEDATSVIWDVKTGDPITPPFKHAKPVVRVEFSDDDTVLVTTDEEGDRWSWPLRIETRPVDELERLAGPLPGSDKTSPP
jgi:WD40 repeat protein